MGEAGGGGGAGESPLTVKNSLVYFHIWFHTRTHPPRTHRLKHQMDDCNLA